MAGSSEAVKLNNTQPAEGMPAGSRPSSRSLQALVTKAGYATPKVVSFPIDGKKLSQVTFAGNVG